MCRELDPKNLTGFCLAGLGGLAVARSQPETGARLLSAAAAVLGAVGWRLGPTEQAEYDCDVTAARKQLGETAFAAAWAEGQVMPTELAISLALDTPSPHGQNMVYAEFAPNIKLSA